MQVEKPDWSGGGSGDLISISRLAQQLLGEERTTGPGTFEEATVRHRLLKIKPGWKLGEEHIPQREWEHYSWDTNGAGKEASACAGMEEL